MPKEHLQPIGSKVPAEIVEQIDQMCKKTGLTRSQLILEAVKVYLNRDDVGTVGTIDARLSELEKKFQRLA